MKHVTADDLDTPLPLSALGKQPWAPRSRTPPRKVRGRERKDPGPRPIAFSTWWRWIEEGCLALDGTRVRLRGVRTGGRWSVTRRAVEEFFDRLGRRPEPEPRESPRTPGQRSRSTARAEKLLDRARI